MFVIFEPTALPIAKLDLSANAAIEETNISGAVVPKPTMTTPTTSGDIEKLRAVFDAPSTNLSALQMSNPKPNRMAKTGNNKVVKSLNSLLYDIKKRRTSTCAAFLKQFVG